MGNAYAFLGLSNRSPDRVPGGGALRSDLFVRICDTPPHRAAAGGPPEAEADAWP